ncbi:MAG: hypothetical protein E6Q88_07875 [Lysobacteraceae bacterium]|nr:MAG: hypothetical protein E6Q88_07875 [Xanthomonadaceae bacterium]
MRRTGTVAAIAPEQGLAAIATIDRGFTIIELTSDWALTPGDSIAWEEGDALGFETYENLSKGTRDEVFVQEHDVDEGTMRIRLMP